MSENFMQVCTCSEITAGPLTCPIHGIQPTPVTTSYCFECERLKRELSEAQARIKELEDENEYDQRNAAMSQKESATLLARVKELEARVTTREKPIESLLHCLAEGSSLCQGCKQRIDDLLAEAKKGASNE